MKDSINVLRFQTVLAAAIGAALLIGPVNSADAQSQRHGQAKQKRAQAQQTQAAPAETSDQQYPQATRVAPPSKASPQQGKKLQKLVDLYEEEGKADEVRALADEIMAAGKANAYDKSFAAQLAAQSAYEADDSDTAIAYLNQALQLDGLDNNAHYGAMLMIAQLHMQEDRYEQALPVFDRLIEETREQKPQVLALKGNTLYRLERYPEAIAALKQAIATSPDPRNEWTQLLMASYYDAGQTAEAAGLAEQIAARNPDDKSAQLNLANTYLQIDEFQKAVDVLEKLRTTGRLQEEREYKQLYSTYLNIEGKEAEAAQVISEGLLKAILVPDHDNFLAMGQAYYFSDQIGPAISAYQKAAPLAKDGETYLNLAKILWQENRITEAKVAANEAIAKGLKDPGEARKILALKAN